MKTLRYVICDVFTEQPLSGNPLAVFTDARGLDTATLQALAREMNLSETTFVLPPRSGGHAQVRIFTPRAELAFAGHPTLGTAFVLGGPMELPELRLELPIGIVPVRLEREGARLSFGWMTQPRAEQLATDSAPLVLQALGVRTRQPPVASFQNGQSHFFVELESARAVAELAPDFTALAKATPAGVCAFHFDGQFCKVRYFAAAHGILEDPATGSAAGPLAFWLRQTGRIRDGQILRLEQGVEISRPSVLYARVSGVDPDVSIEVGGCARIVARGQFVI